MTKSSFSLTYKNKSLEINLDTGASQAHGSVIVSHENTSVMATACFSDEVLENDQKSIPLRIDYLERFYSIHQILGSRYTRREGKPSDEAVLTARLIDRSIRPHLPKGLRNPLHVVVTVLSLGKTDPDCLSVIASSIAIQQTGINWSGPVVCSRTLPTSNTSESLLVAGTTDLANMVEFSGNQIPEEIVSQAFLEAVKENNQLIEDISELDLEGEVNAIVESINESISDNAIEISEQLEKLSKGNRSDERAAKSLREVNLLVNPILGTHGSARFSRGNTNVLSISTLGSPDEILIDESIESVKNNQKTKRFINHYNFPPYAVGFAGRISSPNRREIGHGYLVKRSIEPLLPNYSDYPYAIRLVSEVLSSDGSSSMAAVCAGSLALKSAGIPMDDFCAGIAVGLAGTLSDPILLTDITAQEDAFGLMDMKIAGTTKGLTAIQLDTKISGINLKIFNEALKTGRDAREEIIETMRSNCSEIKFTHPENAPLIIEVPREHIGRLIGKGGSNIRNIEQTTGAKVAVENDKHAIITGTADSKKKVLALIEAETREYHVGEDFQAKVREFLPYGAIVELDAGREALLHVSELRDSFVERTEDLLKVGDEVPVTIVETSSDGRVKVSIREKHPKFFEEGAEGEIK